MFLTARDLEEDVLKGYELGADDYITKPFSIHVLRKKIDVILRRLENHPRNAYDDGFLRIDFDKAQVSAGDMQHYSYGIQDAAAVHRPCRPVDDLFGTAGSIVGYGRPVCR